MLEVAIHRPEVRNAFNEVMIAEFHELFDEIAQNAKVRLVLLRGSGPLFCAGGDLNWMKKGMQWSEEENLKDTTILTKMFKKMNECPKPVVGAIHGAAIGGGVGLVSVCDYVLATHETSFSLSEVRLGIVPACIGPFVVAKIGASHARSLFVSAERFKALRAKEVGLVHEVVDDLATLEVRLKELLENMLQCGPHAMAAAKQLVLELTWPEKRNANPDAIAYVSKMLAKLRVSPEGVEGISAFLEKRKPTWWKK